MAAEEAQNSLISYNTASDFFETYGAAMLQELVSGIYSGYAYLFGFCEDKTASFKTVILLRVFKKLIDLIFRPS